MNNKDLVAELARRMGKTQKEMQSILTTTTQVMVDALCCDQVLSVQGFGTFEVRKKQDKVLVNPTTKQKMVIPPKLSLVFKMGNTYKNKLKNQSTRGK